jgi:hypothetical protein
MRYAAANPVRVEDKRIVPRARERRDLLPLEQLASISSRANRTRGTQGGNDLILRPALDLPHGHQVGTLALLGAVYFYFKQLRAMEAQRDVSHYRMDPPSVATLGEAWPRRCRRNARRGAGRPSRWSSASVASPSRVTGIEPLWAKDGERPVV